MQYCYSCCLSRNRWTGQLYIIRKGPEICEAYAEARGSGFHMIIGHYERGLYLFEANHNFGCQLSRLDDTYWNREQIKKHLCPADTESLVEAVNCLSRLEKNDT